MRALEQVALFHAKFGYPDNREEGPAFPSEEERQWRWALIQEEYEELMSAEEANDLVEFADGLGDLIYVLLGTALVYGIDLSAVFDEIHSSNLSKTPAPGGKPAKLEDFRAPDIAKAMGL